MLVFVSFFAPIQVFCSSKPLQRPCFLFFNKISICYFFLKSRAPMTFLVSHFSIKFEYQVFITKSNNSPRGGIPPHCFVCINFQYQILVSNFSIKSNTSPRGEIPPYCFFSIKFQYQILVSNFSIRFQQQILVSNLRIKSNNSPRGEFPLIVFSVNTNKMKIKGKY